MSKIAILTDSSCDIPQELAEKYGIDIMGFHILLDDEDIVEREKYTPEEFYDKMRAAKGIPSTAAITPIQFCEKYCQYVDEGYTDVIHVPINRSGSSTYNNAVMAQGMLREERPDVCGSDPPAGAGSGVPCAGGRRQQPRTHRPPARRYVQQHQP